MERQTNYALQPMTKAAFVDLVSAEQMEAPDYFTYDAVLNTKELPTLTETLERRADAAPARPRARAAATGAEILDTREPTDFAAAHLTEASTSGSAASTRRGPARFCGAIGRS